MKTFGCAKEGVVVILILCGIAHRVNGASWSGPPYNLAIAHGQTGTITCRASEPPHWRAPSPPDPTGFGLGNTNNDTLPGYNINEFPREYYHLQFTGNVSSTPTVISCSEGTGIERKVHVIVIKLPVINETSTANVSSITCSAEFRAEVEWRPYFDYEQTNGAETQVGARDSDGIRTITVTFPIAEDSKKTAEVCSIISFNNRPEDIEKEANDTATNIPDPLHFSDPVQNIAVSPAGPYYRGAKVRCTAEGYPYPTFKWTHLKSGAVVDGDTLVINGEAGDKYNCTATNTVRGNLTSLNITIDVVSLSDCGPGCVGIIVGCVVAVIVGIVVALIICCRVDGCLLYEQCSTC